MKETLSANQVADALRADEYGGWTYAGARAMAEYLEELEDDTGEELELDVVAIRCDYSEYASLQEWAAGYFADWKAALAIDRDMDDDDIDNAIREHIRDNGQLIEFDGGVIVSSF